MVVGFFCDWMELYLCGEPTDNWDSCSVSTKIMPLIHFTFLTTLR